MVGDFVHKNGSKVVGTKLAKNMEAEFPGWTTVPWSIVFTRLYHCSLGMVAMT
jgi:hypothetical protein